MTEIKTSSKEENNSVLKSLLSVYDGIGKLELNLNLVNDEGANLINFNLVSHIRLNQQPYNDRITSSRYDSTTVNSPTSL